MSPFTTWFLGLFLFLSASARADWVENSKVTYEASTEKEIRQLIERFPERLSHEKAESLSYLSLEVKKFRWEGASSCPSSDDPRLFHEDFSTEARGKPGPDGRIPASAGSASLSSLANDDPCAKP